MEQNDEVPELIVCAAVQFLVIDTGRIITIPSVRHHDKTMRIILNSLEHKDIQEHSQGFMTNLGHYVNQGEAFDIAKAANQIGHKTGGENSEILFSEDLY